jgi:GNAT superfamily N-acetyltransferase
MDYDTYANLQKRYMRTVSNDYTLPADLRKRFDCGVMTVIADDKALFLFERRSGFIKLHFRLMDLSAELKSQEADLAAFLIYRQRLYPTSAADWLQDQGLSKIKTLRRYTAAEITGSLSVDGVEQASADEAYEMFGKHFIPVEADLPCRELFEGALCIRSRDGKPIGVLYMGQTLVVAVAPEARGQGIGRKLYRAYAATKTREGKRTAFHEWISPDNTASIAMFQGLGFTPDDVITDIYQSIRDDSNGTYRTGRSGQGLPNRTACVN